MAPHTAPKLKELLALCFVMPPTFSMATRQGPSDTSAAAIPKSASLSRLLRVFPARLTVNVGMSKTESVPPLNSAIAPEKPGSMPITGSKALGAELLMTDDRKKKRGPKITRPEALEKLSDAAHPLRPQTEWFDKRLAELGVTKESAAKALELSYQKFQQTIADPAVNAQTRRVTLPEFIRFARVLRVSLDDLAYRFGVTDAPAQSTRVRCIGDVGADGRITYRSAEAVSKVAAPVSQEIAAAVMAAIIVRETNDGRFTNATFYFSPPDAKGAAGVTFNRLAVIAFNKKRADVLGYTKKLPNDFVSIMPFGGAAPEVVPKTDIKTAVPIEWIRAP